MQELIQELYDSIDFTKHVNCEQKSESATNCPECLALHYRENTHTIDYRCAQKRKIYLMKYAPVHVKEIYMAGRLTPSSFWVSLNQKKQVRILSIGGGMGVDGAAFIEIFKNKRDSLIEELVIGMLDKENQWIPLAKRLIRTQSEGLNFQVSIQKKICDICQIINQKYKEFDFISMSYVISELNDTDIENVARNIFHFSRKEFILIINDRIQNSVEAKVNNLIKELRELYAEVDIKFEKDDVEDKREWCGVLFSDEIKQSIAPKLKTKSLRYNIHLKKK